MKTAEVIDLDRATVKRGLIEETVLLIDVREPHEYSAGHIPGSISMPLSTFDPRSLRMSGDTMRRVVFSCAAGVRSVRALEMSQAVGLPYREHYLGGYKDWVAAGEPTS